MMEKSRENISFGNNLYFDTMALVKFARSSHQIIGPLAARN
jgi:hypothetical protein